MKIILVKDNVYRVIHTWHSPLVPSIYKWFDSVSNQDEFYLLYRSENKRFYFKLDN